MPKDKQEIEAAPELIGSSQAPRAGLARERPIQRGSLTWPHNANSRFRFGTNEKISFRANIPPDSAASQWSEPTLAIEEQE